jgi:cyclophilin family peptidyl-prolyl cis-trans isomerase
MIPKLDNEVDSEVNEIMEQVALNALNFFYFLFSIKVISRVGHKLPPVPLASRFENPRVFFDISVEGQYIGRIVFELYRHGVPKTAENFHALCTHLYGFGYKYSYFHRIIPGFMCQAGDFEKSDGTGGSSIYGDRFDTEGFVFKYDQPGLLSMANCGKDTNDSQFFIITTECLHLDNKHVIFGRVLSGVDVVQAVEDFGTEDGQVFQMVRIENCGEIVTLVKIR